ncbi:rab-GTPase-TBC domain-containing protein [Fusarium oxysporum II5]|nr:rab-GTPase-TBC domain-containing protein [Fusarium oxysporum II5]
MARDPAPETPKMAHDSLVTVRLSEPDPIVLDSPIATSTIDTNQTTPTKDPVDNRPDTPISRKSSLLVDDKDDKDEKDDSLDDESKTLIKEDVVDTEALRSSSATMPPPILTTRSLQDELADDGNLSDDQDEVNWAQLEQKEDEQTKDEETDNENAKLATNPKSVKVQGVDRATAERSAVSRPRPPSMAQLRQMVQGPTPAALRYSMLPPPPMTDLEFYAALVKDYKQTAARLPTLLSNKIRKGIPPPLRGVVWQSMSGARDAILEEQFDRFCGESSPYEVIIGKDLGRSFPGVDMFRDPEGDGQRMLGRVLKCFSLYDTKIGYCQGLAFLVGPLLMHMPDKQAFCVLVRLMEQYDLRACFLPDLSGLHVRIYQFKELLRQSLPVLSNHLDELQVDPAYVSQWFLSFFAVTCPLPMLFRTYDVIFAEGASETLMRVALSLMRKNEARLLACTEMEDVMQLLLSRGLWDCYHYNADEFVQDFVGLTGAVTAENMQQLEQSYRESKTAITNPVRGSEITTAASRFLGRIWATSTNNKSSNLSPGNTAPARPTSMLRRSASKQSLASTLNSMEASSASVTSSSSTDVTSMSRDSSNTEDGRESTPVGNKTITAHKNTDERNLHSQIEDLLTALSELQRNHALLSNQLQREREERQEDRKAVQSLLNGLRQKADSATSRPSSPQPSVLSDKEDSSEADKEDKSETEGDESKTPSPEEKVPASDDEAQKGVPSTTEDLENLLNVVEQRFQVEDDKRRSSMLISKAQLRDELNHAKDQLAAALSQSQEYSRQILDLNQEMATSSAHEVTKEHDVDRGSKTGGGLREFKLNRSKTTPHPPQQQPQDHEPMAATTSKFNKRISSLPQNHEASVPMVTTTGPAPSQSEHEALLAELVQAKTAEAVAKQEAEEARQKLESIRKSHGLSRSVSAHAPSASQSGPGGVFSLLTGHGAAATNEVAMKPASTNAGSPGSGGSFWGWRR